MASTKLDVHIRWMIRRDIPIVLDIESYNPDPWEESTILRCLRDQNCIGMVAELQDETIAGFMIYNLHAKVIEVLNLAVHPVFHRQGVGSALIEKLTSKLCCERRNKLRYYVRDDNLPAHLFLKSQGFIATEILHEDFLAPGDAYRFEYVPRECC
jgi:ribosomal-protein-alanine N-acetyltransferase